MDPPPDGIPAAPRFTSMGRAVQSLETLRLMMKRTLIAAAAAAVLAVAAPALAQTAAPAGMTLAQFQAKNGDKMFARLDTNMALAIIKEDDAIDGEYNGFLRKLITYMMEDPRTISPSLDLLFLAKSLERVGDHAKNIAEQIIFVVKGEDVRHSSMHTVQSVVG